MFYYDISSKVLLTLKYSKCVFSFIEIFLSLNAQSIQIYILYTKILYALFKCNIDGTSIPKGPVLFVWNYSIFILSHHVGQSIIVLLTLRLFATPGTVPDLYIKIRVIRN